MVHGSIGTDRPEALTHHMPSAQPCPPVLRSATNLVSIHPTFNSKLVNNALFSEFANQTWKQCNRVVLIYLKCVFVSNVLPCPDSRP